ncbi:MAG TPA: PQQ-binding-like beta-propeller repeat protein, partial [Gemmataceae bacterium]|nr:PQQ-binding-like beta-propeller repeat protein [Gemmataceae bacterium]
VSPEKIEPWKEAPKVLWRQPVGEGHSSPVVSGGKVFVHAKVKDKDEEEVAAFDAKTGESLWKKNYSRGSFSNFFGNGPRGTPAVVGNHIYTFGVTGFLSCFETATGILVWQVNTLKDFNGKNLFFGMSGSPLIVDHLVLMNVGAAGASLVAFNKETGKVEWKKLDDKASYSSPILIGAGSRRQAVFLTQAGLVSVNPADGTSFWNYPFADDLSESSTTPISAGDTLMASSITKGSVGLQLTNKDGTTSAKEVWKNPELTCYFSTPLAVDKDHIFVVTGTKPPALNIKADLHCVEAKTGKTLWQKPKVGKYHATLLRTWNNKLLMLDDAGNLMLLEPNLKEYQEVCKAKVCGETWAHPALSAGRLYVRDRDELICLQLY